MHATLEVSHKRKPERRTSQGGQHRSWPSKMKTVQYASRGQCSSVVQHDTKTLRITVTSITSLPNTPYSVLKPLQVVVRQMGVDNYVAQVPSANINSSGDTVAEAIVNLKDMVVGIYAMVSSRPLACLGPGPTRQRAILNKHISRRK
jgi:hypothetical protein